MALKTINNHKLCCPIRMPVIIIPFACTFILCLLFRGREALQNAERASVRLAARFTAMPGSVLEVAPLMPTTSGMIPTLIYQSSPLPSQIQKRPSTEVEEPSQKSKKSRTKSKAVEGSSKIFASTYLRTKVFIHNINRSFEAWVQCQKKERSSSDCRTERSVFFPVKKAQR